MFHLKRSIHPEATSHKLHAPNSVLLPTRVISNFSPFQSRSLLYLHKYEAHLSSFPKEKYWSFPLLTERHCLWLIKVHFFPSISTHYRLKSECKFQLGSPTQLQGRAGEGVSLKQCEALFNVKATYWLFSQQYPTKAGGVRRALVVFYETTTPTAPEARAARCPARRVTAGEGPAGTPSTGAPFLRHTTFPDRGASAAPA